MRRLGPLCLPATALAAVACLLAPGRSDADDRARSPLIDAPTRSAIERGLRFLARTQNTSGDSDGSWTSDAGHKVNDEYAVVPGGKNVPHVGVTALGILAFLAAGHVPGRGPYGAVVDRAVEFLLSRVQKDGFISGDETRMYSHAFATLALAEVYGMSQAPELRVKLQRAVELTIKCQNETGGWRYAPFTIDSDMSVTVCQMVALRAAMNVGLKVRQETIDRALRYVVDSAITSDMRNMADMRTMEDEVGGFLYQPKTTHWNRSSFSLTAAGLTTLFQAGIYDDDALAHYLARTNDRRDPPPSIRRAVNYMERTFEDAARKPKHYFFFYGNYYAAQAMYNVGGTEPARWERWYTRVRTALLASQVTGGDRPDESHWESNIGDTHAFGTAVAILILSMPFDYLPIHQK